MKSNKSGCLSVGADILLRTILPLWPKEEREVPAWSRSHPLLIEHLSPLVMGVEMPAAAWPRPEVTGEGQTVRSRETAADRVAYERLILEGDVEVKRRQIKKHPRVLTDTQRNTVK